MVAPPMNTISHSLLTARLPTFLVTLLATLLVTSLLMFSTPADAGLYKYRDENGNVVYSQTPPESGEYEYMQTPRSQPSAQRAPTPAATPGASPAGRPAQDPLTDPAASDDPAVQAELARAQEIRRQNCERAKKNLEVYTVFRRIKNEDGEVVYVDDNVRQQRIEEAKAAIKEFCN